MPDPILIRRGCKRGQVPFGYVASCRIRREPYALPHGSVRFAGNIERGRPRTPWRGRGRPSHLIGARALAIARSSKTLSRLLVHLPFHQAQLEDAVAFSQAPVVRRTGAPGRPLSRSASRRCRSESGQHAERNVRQAAAGMEGSPSRTGSPIPRPSHTGCACRWEGGRNTHTFFTLQGVRMVSSIWETEGVKR